MNDAAAHPSGTSESTLQDQIVAAIKKNDAVSAIYLARVMADQQPPSADGLIILADAFLRSNQAEMALQVVGPYLEKFPNHTGLLWATALGYGNTYQHGKAEPYLRKVVEQAPAWPNAQYLLGRNLYKAGRDIEAIPYLREAVRMKPGHFDALQLLALNLQEAGIYEEAREVMARANAIKPDTALQQNLGELEQIVKAPPPSTAFARWPKAAPDFDDVKSLIKDYIVENFDTAGIQLRRGMGVFTQGSCFAGNLANSLRRYDLRVDHMPCGEEHNSTFANRVVIDWLRGTENEHTAIVEENLSRDKRAEYLEALQKTDIFVYTMGLAPAHFDRKSGAFVMSRHTNASKAALFKRAVFRTSSVQENVDNLAYIVSAIRELAPKAAVILTVSPVPLRVTTEFNSAIVADCVSKSTLRVAVHELMQKNLPRILYWPSFEIIRWVGAHIAGRVYGSDDGSSHHVDARMVNHIMDAFIDRLGDEDLKSSLRP